MFSGNINIDVKGIPNRGKLLLPSTKTVIINDLIFRINNTESEKEFKRLFPN